MRFWPVQLAEDAWYRRLISLRTAASSGQRAITIFFEGPITPVSHRGGAAQIPGNAAADISRSMSSG